MDKEQLKKIIWEKLSKTLQEKQNNPEIVSEDYDLEDNLEVAEKLLTKNFFDVVNDWEDNNLDYYDSLDGGTLESEIDDVIFDFRDAISEYIEGSDDDEIEEELKEYLKDVAYEEGLGNGFHQVEYNCKGDITFTSKGLSISKDEVTISTISGEDYSLYIPSISKDLYQLAYALNINTKFFANDIVERIENKFKEVCEFDTQNAADKKHLFDDFLRGLSKYFNHEVKLAKSNFKKEIIKLFIEQSRKYNFFIDGKVSSVDTNEFYNNILFSDKDGDVDYYLGFTLDAKDLVRHSGTVGNNDFGNNSIKVDCFIYMEDEYQLFKVNGARFNSDFIDKFEINKNEEFKSCNLYNRPDNNFYNVNKLISSAITEFKYEIINEKFGIEEKIKKFDDLLNKIFNKENEKIIGYYYSKYKNLSENYLAEIRDSKLQNLNAEDKQFAVNCFENLIVRFDKLYTKSEEYNLISQLKTIENEIKNNNETLKEEQQKLNNFVVNIMCHMDDLPMDTKINVFKNIEEVNVIDYNSSYLRQCFNFKDTYTSEEIRLFKELIPKTKNVFVKNGLDNDILITLLTRGDELKFKSLIEELVKHKEFNPKFSSINGGGSYLHQTSNKEIAILLAINGVNPMIVDKYGKLATEGYKLQKKITLEELNKVILEKTINNISANKKIKI